MSAPTVAAIVVTFHTGPRLKECLYALAANADIAEIIIVDNGNPAPHDSLARRLHGPLRDGHLSADR